ncbi:GNAT family N-acetyltransferase [Alsobacter sp. SYSU BS001988]
MADASYRAAFSSIVGEAFFAARTPADLAARFTASLDRMRVADRDGAVVAFSMVTGTHLDMLFVDPAAQGTGAGAALLADAEARGARSLESFRDNHAARAFYERHGWRLTREYERDVVGGVYACVFYEKG